MIDFERRTIVHLALLGMPELKLFPDRASREAAIAEVRAGSGPHALLGRCLLLVGVLVLAFQLALWVVFSLILQRSLAIQGGWWSVVTMALYMPMVCVLHRRMSAPTLRRALVRHGVPICVKCGYLLRGLPSATTKCPECGDRLDGFTIDALVADAASRAKATDEDS